MASGQSYVKNFLFPLAYDFLKVHGLEEPAREISEELKIGVMALSDVELCEYQLTMSLNRVSE